LDKNDQNSNARKPTEKNNLFNPYKQYEYVFHYPSPTRQLFILWELMRVLRDNIYIKLYIMDTLVLNSESYSKEEIEKLLHLSKPYTNDDIFASKKRLMKQFAISNLDMEKQREIADFIDAITLRVKNDVDTQNVHSVIQEGSNFIIENPDRIIGRTAKIENGRITLESKSAPPGYLNPLNVRTITQAISIDSRFRPNYYGSKSTNYDLVLPAIQKNVVSLRVASIEMPMTYYAISRCMENTTCLVVDTNAPTHGWLLTLPDGNYEQSWASNSKASHIETAMNETITYSVAMTLNVNGGATPSGGASLLATDLTFNLDRISGKAFFAAPAGSRFAAHGFTMLFNVDPQGNQTKDSNLQLRLGWQLGFRDASYVVAPAALMRCVSEGICLVCGPRYGFISIDDYQKNTGPAYMVAYANSVLQDNIITRINLAELQADVGVYQSSSDPGLSTQLNRTREYFGPVDIQRLHISLFDEFGRIIDLNYMDWSLTLAFELLYN
jgi:hypothetical protein